MSASSEITIHINSAQRSNTIDNPGNFVVNYNNGGNLQDALYIRPRSLMIPNMFNNVYGRNAVLYLAMSPILTITVPPGLYSFADLCALVTSQAAAANVLDPLFPPIVLTPTEVSPGIVKAVLSTASPTQATALLGVQNLRDLGISRSMNEILGVGVYATAPVIGVFTTVLEFTPSMFTPQRVYATSDRLSFGKSIDPTSLTQSMFSSVNMSGIPQGSYASHETPDSSLFTFVFREPRELQSIDIKLRDAYGDILDLPLNAHVDVVVVIGLKHP